MYKQEEKEKFYMRVFGAWNNHLDQDADRAAQPAVWALLSQTIRITN